MSTKCSPLPWTIYKTLIRDAERRPIADVYGGDSDPTHVANKALFAAAPDLLVACTAAMHTLEALDFDEPIDVEESGIDSLISDLRAAIAKATSQPQPTSQ